MCFFLKMAIRGKLEKPRVLLIRGRASDFPIIIYFALIDWDLGDSWLHIPDKLRKLSAATERNIIEVTYNCVFHFFYSWRSFAKIPLQAMNLCC